MLAPGTPSATLHCHVADATNGPLQIEWFHDGIPLAPLLLAEQDRDRFKMDGNEYWNWGNISKYIHKSHLDWSF
jgi:hypothetical protein